MYTSTIRQVRSFRVKDEIGMVEGAKIVGRNSEDFNAGGRS